jgi:hypothetical protein
MDLGSLPSALGWDFKSRQLWWLRNLRSLCCGHEVYPFSNIWCVLWQPAGSIRKFLWLVSTVYQSSRHFTRPNSLGWWSFEQQISWGPSKQGKLQFKVNYNLFHLRTICHYDGHVDLTLAAVHQWLVGNTARSFHGEVQHYNNFGTKISSFPQWEGCADFLVTETSCDISEEWVFFASLC